MQDPVKNAAQVDAGAAPSLEEDGKVISTDTEDGVVEDGGKKVPEGGEAVEIDTNAVTRDEKGNFVWRPDPNDNSIVYIGKTLDEMLGNAAKNISDKEAYIQRLRSAQKIDPSAHRNRHAPGVGEDPSAGREEIAFPDMQGILSDMCRRENVDPSMFGWSREKWHEFETERGAVETLELRQTLKDLRSKAESRFSEENVVAVNAHSLYDESDSVADMLTRSGVPLGTGAGQLDFDTLVDRVYSDPNNFFKNGVRKNGRIVAAAHEEIQKIVIERTKADTQKKTDEEIANARERKVTVPGAPGSHAPMKKPLVQPAKTTADALAAVKRAMAKKT